MKKHLYLLACVIFLSCTQDPTEHQKFLSHFKKFCGNAYPGRTTLATISPEQLFLDAELTMHLIQCKKNEIRMRVDADGDSSRTWILAFREKGLHLSHYHRNTDYTEQQPNQYGGYANMEGDDIIQFFPADSRLFGEPSPKSLNTWTLEIDPDEKKVYYRLYVVNALRLEMEFDLSSPMLLD